MLTKNRLVAPNTRLLVTNDRLLVAGDLILLILHVLFITPRFLINGFGIFWDFGVFSVFWDPGTNILGNRGLNRKLQVDTYILGVASTENPLGSDSKIGLPLEKSKI